MSTPAEADLPLIISVDDHVMEPKDLWQRELPASLRDKAPRVVRVPYLNIYNCGPGVLLDRGVFCSVLLDWYNTESSSFYCERAAVEQGKAFLNGGSVYLPLTDGTRNPMGERLFVSVSSRFDEVLPNIPNPPSTQKEVSRNRLYCHIGGIAPDRFDGYIAKWREFHRKGIRQVRVSHHEDAWTNGADVGQGGQEYTMCIEAAPEVGDDKLIAYCREMRAMGYYIGLYENFTDYNPLGKSWDERNAARNTEGELVRVWPPTYIIRPLKALEMALTQIERQFGKGSIMKLGEDNHRFQIAAIPTGALSLDLALAARQSAETRSVVTMARPSQAE